MIKLVVFDWNGTLLADSQAAFEASNERLVALGLKKINRSHYLDTFEVPIGKFYENLHISPEIYLNNVAEQAKAFHDFYERRVDRSKTRSGAHQILSILEKKDISRIIFSNHNVLNITRQLDRLNLLHHFDVILANDNIHATHNKGKRDYLYNYLKTVNFKPSEIIIIGDTTEEIEIGKELNLITVGITGGFISTKRLKVAQPHFIINKLLDLEKVIQSCNKTAKLKVEGGV